MDHIEPEVLSWPASAKSLFQRKSQPGHKYEFYFQQWHNDKVAERTDLRWEK